jgi:hypothetical protein
MNAQKETIPSNAYFEDKYGPGLSINAEGILVISLNEKITTQRQPIKIAENMKINNTDMILCMGETFSFIIKYQVYV